MYCRKCGKEIDGDAGICQECNVALERQKALSGKSIDVESSAEAKGNASISSAQPKKKRGLGGIIVGAALVAVAVAIIAFGGYASSRCHADGCTNAAQYGDYCARHVCLYPGCTNQRSTWSSSDYCYVHKGADSASTSGTGSVSGGTTVGTTSGNSNAVAKARNYLEVSAFSRQGLIDQLEFEGFSESEAEYGVSHCGANWSEQAVKKAKQYLEISSFSRSRLIDQLEFEGFTHEQAEYGVRGAGYY